MHYSFKTEGVCSTQIEIELDGNIIKDVQFIGGCEGNLTGISKLVVGMTVEEVQQKLTRITCDGKPTSCPDQLVMAVTQARNLVQVVDAKTDTCGKFD
ncbi:MAG: TIGR03905 family TSCPD domain-containing protein [Candidatus Riflebacteria bacterium]|nr:TIGR03905 family TSCPD domain-containing protein [Candidatus Riflebacteria bacterium]